MSEIIGNATLTEILKRLVSRTSLRAGGLSFIEPFVMRLR